jgi:hypothetical protein
MVKQGTLKESFELLLFDVLEFLAHLAKGKVSFCHHLASVVYRPSSVVH